MGSNNALQCDAHVAAKGGDMGFLASLGAPERQRWA
jgi:hypothetical protein